TQLVIHRKVFTDNRLHIRRIGAATPQQSAATPAPHQPKAIATCTAIRVHAQVRTGAVIHGLIWQGFVLGILKGLLLNLGFRLLFRRRWWRWKRKQRNLLHDFLLFDFFVSEQIFHEQAKADGKQKQQQNQQQWQTFSNGGTQRH